MMDNFFFTMRGTSEDLWPPGREEDETGEEEEEETVIPPPPSSWVDGAEDSSSQPGGHHEDGSPLSPPLLPWPHLGPLKDGGYKYRMMTPYRHLPFGAQ